MVGGSFNLFSQKNSYPIEFNYIGPGFYSSSDDDARTTYLGVAPYIGLALNERWLLSIQGRYALELYKSTGTVFDDFFQEREVDYRRANVEYRLGIFSRYSIKPQNTLYLFVQPSIQYGHGKFTSETDGNPSPERTASYLHFGVAPGLAWNVSPRVRLLANLGSLEYITGSAARENSPEKRKFSSFVSNFYLSSVYFGVEMRF